MVQIKAWIRTHPWQATGRALWVLFNMAWGAAAAGFATWGPLMAGPAVIALLALLGAALQGLPWAWQMLWRGGSIGHSPMAFSSMVAGNNRREMMTVPT